MNIHVFRFFSGFCCGIILYFVGISICPKLFTVHNTNVVFEFELEKEKVIYYDPRLERKISGLQYEAIKNAVSKSKPMSDKGFHNDNTEVADRLKSSIRVFCAVFTHRNFVTSYAMAVNNTWGKRCTDIKYFSTTGTPSHGLPMVHLKYSDKPNVFLKRMIVAILHVFSNHYNDADWFLFSSDTTFIIMENLRYFLADKNPNEPIIFGAHSGSLKIDFLKTMNVMSKKALLFLATGDLENCFKSQKSKSGPTMDLYMDLCMHDSGIEVGSIQDENGKDLFNIMDPRKSNSLHEKFIQNNLSKYVVSIRNIHPRAMFGLDYLIYHLRPFGILDRY